VGAVASIVFHARWMHGSLRGAARARAPISLGSGSRRGLFAWVGREPFVLLVLAAQALVLAVRLPNLVAPDTWLALVAGRKISADGLPHHDTLTIWSHGAKWVDQQWLGQFVMYGVQVLGGLRLVLVLTAVVFVATFALALLFARRSGGSGRSGALVGAVALFVAYPNSVARTQVFALLFFVAVFGLLGQDARRPSRRVFLVLPILVLWANIHGSAVLGAGLVLLWAFASIVRLRRGRDVRRELVRVAPLAFAAPLSLLASPYAFELPGYYKDLIGAPAFRNFVSEWAPTTFPEQWPFFVLGLAALWLAASKPARLSLFEHLALLFTFVAGLDAVRNISWFALVAAIVVPRALDAVWPPDQAPVRQRVNRLLAVGSIAALVGAIAAMAVRQLELPTLGYSPLALDAVAAATARDPSARVFANEWYSDWLLWNLPRLESRIAFDIRFELLSSRQIRSVANFRGRTSPDWLAAAAGYRVLVLDPGTDTSAVRAVRREPGTRRPYHDRHVTVLLRSAHR
jgi:hypothetical protein